MKTGDALGGIGMKKAIAIMVAVLILACLLLTGCNITKLYFPTSGIWYCEQLQMQLAFDNSKFDYNVFIINNILYACMPSYDPGMSTISIVYKDDDRADYSLGDIIFHGAYVKSNETSFTLRELYGDREFVFIRVEEPVLEGKHDRRW